MPSGNGDAELKIIVVQTPMGIMQVALPAAELDGNPVETAMNEFQQNVEAGLEDPLQTTLNNLKDLSDQGEPQPLIVGLALLEQMSEGGMLPPMQQILEGTSVSSADLDKAHELVAKAKNLGSIGRKPEGPDIDDQIDKVSFN
ncbi:MAG: hypothetical protein L3J82_04185 [Planctomycetes bacterium]|nr:hypothetical protein [Planctomycetota bacterium]